MWWEYNLVAVSLATHCSDLSAICYVQNNLLNNHFHYLNYSILTISGKSNVVITVNNMGNANSKKNPNANCGKYQKKWFAATTPVNSITEVSVTENREINLENLKTHLQELTQHVRSNMSVLPR